MVAPMFIAFGIRPAAIGKFRAEHPQTRISLEIKNIRDIADWVANGLFDMAVTPLPFDDARVETELFATGRAVVIMPKRHPLAAKRIVPLKDLRSESIVLPSIGTSTRTQCDGAFESVGLKPNCMIEATSHFSRASWLRVGSGSV